MTSFPGAGASKYFLRQLQSVSELFLFERRCTACSLPFLPHGGTDNRISTFFCPSCAKDLVRRTAGFCPRCGRLAPWPQMPPAVCGPCLAEPPPWEALLFHGPYEGILRSLLLLLKFGNDTVPAKSLASLLASHPGWDGLKEHSLLPVPLHRERLKERGYNQTLELGRSLSAATGLPLMRAGLVRTRLTAPQTSLPLSGRRKNLEGAFAADPAHISGRHLVLLDDVASSGATLRAAAETLRGAGAASVTAAAIARA